jgi:hypothetical protein
MSQFRVLRACKTDTQAAQLSIERKFTPQKNGEPHDADLRAPEGSLALADDRLYYPTEKTLLIEKQYIERGRFNQPDGSPSRPGCTL